MKKKKTDIVKFTSDESSRIGDAIIAESTERPEEFGRRLMEEAGIRNQKVFMETVVSRAQELSAHLNNLFIAKDKLDREISLFEKRIAAVRDGKFKLTNDGRLLYNDILLQY